jgi:hypothetical protein
MFEVMMEEEVVVLVVWVGGKVWSQVGAHRCGLETSDVGNTNPSPSHPERMK